MKDLVEIIKTELPKFFINLVNILFNSKRQLLKLYYDSSAEKEKYLAKALIYFIICLVLSQLWLIPINGSVNTVKGYTWIHSLISGVILLLLVSVCAKIVWIFIPRKIPFLKYFVISSYQVGTFLAVFLFINFINLSLLRYFSPEDFNTHIGYTYLGTIDEIAFLDNLSNGIFFSFYLINALTIIFFVGWFFHSFRVYREIHKTSRGQHLYALFVFMLLLVVAAFITVVTSSALSES